MTDQVDNGRRAIIEIEDIYSGPAGVRGATMFEAGAWGAELAVAFHPTRPRRKPRRAAEMFIDGERYDILNVEASPVTAGFYLAYVRRVA